MVRQWYKAVMMQSWCYNAVIFEWYLEQWMDLIDRQSQWVSPLPLLNGCLSISNCPLIDGVWKTLLDSLLWGRGEER